MALAEQFYDRTGRAHLAVVCHNFEMGKERTVSGLHAVVVVPDRSTCQVVTRMAAQSPKIAFRTKKPHVSLFHVDLDNAPVTDIAEVLKDIETGIENAELRFKSLAIFGGKFVFWDTEITPALRVAHERALDLAELRNPNGASSSADLELKLTVKEQEYEQKYGYILVRDLYRPHATVGFYNDSIDAPEIEAPAGHIGSVASVGLYLLSGQGRILNEIVNPNGLTKTTTPTHL